MDSCLVEHVELTRKELVEIIWDVYLKMERHAHTSEIWQEVMCDARVSGEALSALLNAAGADMVRSAMKVKHPQWGVARAWKTPDGWQQLPLLTADEMAFDIMTDAKAVSDDLFQLKKKRDVMFAFHGWAPEIPEIVTK